MSTLSKKPPDREPTLLVSHYGQKPTFLTLLWTTSGKFIRFLNFLLCLSFLLSLNPFTKCDGGIVTMTTLSNLFQDHLHERLSHMS